MIFAQGNITYRLQRGPAGRQQMGSMARASVGVTALVIPLSLERLRCTCLMLCCPPGNWMGKSVALRDSMLELMTYEVYFLAVDLF